MTGRHFQVKCIKNMIAKTHHVKQNSALINIKVADGNVRRSSGNPLEITEPRKKNEGFQFILYLATNARTGVAIGIPTERITPSLTLLLVFKSNVYEMRAYCQQIEYKTFFSFWKF